MKDIGEKKFVVIPFFWSHKFHNIGLFCFRNVEEKNLCQFSKNYRLFTRKIVSKLSKIWAWDPGSGKKPIPDPGVKRHRIPDPDSQHCSKPYKVLSSVCLVPAGLFCYLGFSLWIFKKVINFVPSIFGENIPKA
jgi:hypothetical protein